MPEEDITPTDVTPEPSTGQDVTPESSPEPESKPEPNTQTDPEGGQPEEGNKDRTVPVNHLQDERRKRQDAEKRAQEAEAKLAEAAPKVEGAASADDEGDEELSPEVQKVLDKAIAKILDSKGVVTEEQLQIQEQIGRDVTELSGWAKEQNFPEFDRKAVVEYAKANNLPINGKEGLKSAYQSLHFDAILESAKKSGLAEGAAPTADAEAPSGGAGVAVEDKPKSSADGILATVKRTMANK